MATNNTDLNKKHLQILKDLNNPLKMWFYFAAKLPTILFYGIRLKSCDSLAASAIVPFSYRTKNPFRSIYAGAQFAAAEISTGVLVMATLRNLGNFSMLITKTEIEYVKKATSKTTFTCQEGDRILAIAQQAQATGKGQTIRLLSEGRLASGEVVSRMWFTWSIKER